MGRAGEQLADGPQEVLDEARNLALRELAEVDRVRKEDRHELGRCRLGRARGDLRCIMGCADRQCGTLTAPYLGKVDHLDLVATTAPVVDGARGAPWSVARLTVPHRHRGEVRVQLFGANAGQSEQQEAGVLI